VTKTVTSGRLTRKSSTSPRLGVIMAGESMVPRVGMRGQSRCRIAQSRRWLGC